MAYTAGDTILDDEYNTFVGQNTSPFGYNIFAGTTAAASGNYDQGLGQSNISTVSAGGTITAAQWNSLWTAMNNIANHTNVDTGGGAGVLASTAAVSSGDTIAIKAALITDLAALSAEVAAGSPSATATTTTAVLQTGTSSSTWYGSFTSTFTINFTNANQMRWFFNQGGKVQVYGARTGNGNTGGTANNKDLSWDSLYTALGNITIASKSSTRSGTGETQDVLTDLTLGFHDLDNTEKLIIRLAESTAPYTANYIDVTAQLDAAVGTSTQLTVRVKSIDGAADDTYTAGNTDLVDATVDRNGTHQHYLKTINPNTTEGLATVYTPSSTAVSAATT